MFQYGQDLLVDYNGTRLGAFAEMNFTGAGVSVTNVNGVATVSIPGGLGSILLGQRSIFVSKQGNDATGAVGDIGHDFLTITAALVAAVTLVPSATNVINIVIYPGTYTENITVPAFVNLITAEPCKFLYDGNGYSNVSTKNQNALGNVYVNGTITQSGDHVGIIGINTNTITISVANSNSTYLHIIASTQIKNTSGTDSGTYFDVHSSQFHPDTAINGYLNYCTASTLSWGGSSTANSKNITGTMFNCIGDGDGCFAGNTNLPVGFTAGSIDGTLENCKCNGNYSFASSRTGNGNNITGTLRNCVSNGNFSFSSSANGFGGTISGTLINCTGIASCFACGTDGGTISGTLTNCTAFGSCSFASSAGGIGGTINAGAILRGCKALGNSFASATTAGISAGTIAGKLYDCQATGNNTFASADAGNGIISGKLYNCIAIGDISFASVNISVGGQLSDISGYLFNCIADGNTAFASMQGVTDGLGNTSITGVLRDCVCTGQNSFCSSLAGAAGAISGSLYNCFGESLAFCSGNDFDGGVIAGKLYNCNCTTIGYCSSNLGNGGTINSSAILENCYAGDIGFCSVNDQGLNAGTIAGKLVGCVATGNWNFASAKVGTGGTISGTIISCVAGSISFCSVDPNDNIIGTGGTISGQLFSCKAGSNSFCYGNVIAGSITAAAYLQDCFSDGDYAFCSSENAGGSISGRLNNCIVTGNAGFACGADIALTTGNGGGIDGIMEFCKVTGGFGYAFGVGTKGTISGTLRGCEISQTYGLQYAIVSAGLIIDCRIKNTTTCPVFTTGNSRFEYCDIIAGGGAFSIQSNDGVSAYNIDVRHSNFFGSGIDPLLTILTGTPYNTNDVNSLF